MSFTKSITNTTVHQDMPDYPSAEGYTASQLKTAFDAPATGLKEDINRIVDELEANTAAADLGADAIYEGDESGATVQAKLEHIYEALQDVVTGDIPDNSLTKAKLVTSFANTIPTNVEMGKLYLASQYRTPEITTETPASYSIPQMSSSSHTGYDATWNYTTYASTPTPYELFKGDGSKDVNLSDGKTKKNFTMSLPVYARITSIKATTKCTIRVYGSTDNTTWTLLATFFKYNDDFYTETKAITNTGFYKYLKFEGEGPSSSYSAKVKNSIVVSGTSIDSLTNNTMTIAATEDNELLSAYATGQIVKVTTPSNYIEGSTINSTLDIYELGAKAVPTDLKPSTRYSLVYDGTKFVKE